MPAGRPQGAEGKTRREIRNMLADECPGFHPAILLAKFAQDEEKSDEIRVSCAKELLQYLSPKLRSIDHTSEDGSGLKVVIVDATKAPAPPDGS